uniref:Hexosyltransferase n=1 Tax=Ananas comosus var. bracteatus TaxID=296719 RepID=A0A6V7P9P7_ANACO|nr:unnamed protein product [Ananas comosus var. bracteatus]
MKPSYPQPSSSTLTLTLTLVLVLLPLFLLALIFLLVYPNESKLQAGPATDCSRSSSVLHDAFTYGITVKPDLRLLIGILTLPDSYERRQLVRHAYSLGQPAHAAHVDVRFVFCNLTKEEQRVLVGLEIMQYDDIIILDCQENMDGGKTYTFFSSLPRLFADAPYDYAMKTDDDTYVRVANLVGALNSKPRESLYFGLMTPCFGVHSENRYMSGLGYVLSWDLVEWISKSDVAREHQTGPEDLVTGRWFKEGGRSVQMYDATPAIYDYMEMPYMCYRHEFIPETIAVHKLKGNLRIIVKACLVHGIKNSH